MSMYTCSRNGIPRQQWANAQTNKKLLGTKRPVMIVIFSASQQIQTETRAKANQNPSSILICA
eukprot:4464933-Amphidinium_carterae.1